MIKNKHACIKIDFKTQILIMHKKRERQSFAFVEYRSITLTSSKLWACHWLNPCRNALIVLYFSSIVNTKTGSQSNCGSDTCQPFGLSLCLNTKLSVTALSWSEPSRGLVVKVVVCYQSVSYRDSDSDWIYLYGFIFTHR